MQAASVQYVCYRCLPSTSTTMPTATIEKMTVRDSRSKKFPAYLNGLDMVMHSGISANAVLRGEKHQHITASQADEAAFLTTKLLRSSMLLRRTNMHTLPRVAFSLRLCWRLAKPRLC